MSDRAETGAPAHGGRLAEARRRFPGAPEPFLDLSTGINPFPYPLPPLASELWSRLPEPETIDALQAAAARAYRVADPGSVVAAPGTQIMISLLPHLLGRPAVILGPTYAEYAHSWRLAGLAAHEVTRLDALADAPVAILCNPNNPDGRRIAPAEIGAVADRLAARGGTLVVDEAFADFDAALSVAPLLPHPALIVLRSFGKTYGLAGLRLGFALASPAMATRLRGALGPWSVSGPAAAIATAALADEAWRSRTAEKLAAAMSQLDDALEAVGFRLCGGTALFRLAQSDDAPAVFDRLGHAGILVRRFDAHLAWLRFGLPPDQSAAARLLTALRR